MKAWIKGNWKRLVVANVVGMALQGVLLALLLCLGMAPLPATVLAKTASWVLFLTQIALGKPR